MAQNAMHWFGKWVADSRLGLGRDAALDDFVSAPYGDLTPASLSLLKTNYRVSSVNKDFWGNTRNSDSSWIGAIDLSESSCDVTEKIENRMAIPKETCRVE